MAQLNINPEFPYRFALRTFEINFTVAWQSQHSLGVEVFFAIHAPKLLRKIIYVAHNFIASRLLPPALPGLQDSVRSRVSTEQTTRALRKNKDASAGPRKNFAIRLSIFIFTTSQVVRLVFPTLQCAFREQSPRRPCHMIVI